MPTRRAFFLQGLACAATAVAAGEKRLFDGRTLDGWQGWPGDSSLWIVEDGAIVGRSPGIDHNTFLATADSFGDFELTLEVKLLNDVGNSGVQFRSKRAPDSPEMIGYQADIGPGWWGNLYDESRRRRNLAEADPAVLERVLRRGDWNRYRISANGPHLELALNDQTVATFHETDDVPRTGRIALQIHSGPPLEVRFRDIVLRTL